MLANSEACAALDLILERHARGEVSAPVALMQLLTESEDEAVVAEHAARHPELERLFAANRAGIARICAMLKSGMDTSAAQVTVESGLAFARRLFDWSVEQSEEASVALYSLGNPKLLAAATAEAVALLDRWGLIHPRQRCLQIGCGIGRFEAALGKSVAEARGIDVSENMVAAARRRCRGISNTFFEVTHGRDLAMYPSDRFELVYAVDTFPYLVQAGMELVDDHFAEAHRVLVPGGSLVIMSFSYRDDLERDRADIRRLATKHELKVEVDGERLLDLWDGAAWRLRRAAY